MSVVPTSTAGQRPTRYPRLVGALDRTDRYRPLRWHIGQRRIGPLIAVFVAALPGVGVGAALMGYATGLLARTATIELMLSFAEIPALLLLALCLWCTPATMITGRSYQPARQAFGIGFGVAAWGNLIAFILEHPTKDLRRPFVVLGAVSLVLSLPLVATSTRAALHRIGGPRWRKLHKLAYVIAILTVAHLWLVPQDDGPAGNLVATAVFGTALILRTPAIRRRVNTIRRARGGSLISARTWLYSDRL